MNVTIRAKQPSRSKEGQRGSPQKLNKKFEKHFRALFGGPVEKVEHDLNIEYLNHDGYRAAKKFIHACEKVGIWRLKQGELTEDAGSHLSFLAQELAESIRALIERGDLMLARRLPPIVEILESALSVYGTKITGRVTKHLSIEQILQKQKARDLLEMLSALHPDWETVLHIHNRREIESLTEKSCGSCSSAKNVGFTTEAGNALGNGVGIALPSSSKTSSRSEREKLKTLIFLSSTCGRVGFGV
jgi:hypothetical protein